MGTDDEACEIFSFGERYHTDGLDGCCILEKFASADVYGFVTGCVHADGVFGVGLLFLCGKQAVAFGWGFKFYRFGLTGFVCGQFGYCTVRFSGKGNRDTGIGNGTVIDFRGDLYIQLSLVLF